MITMNDNELKRLQEEVKLLKQKLRIAKLPTLWLRKDNERLEIHYDKKTILAKIDGIDTETPRKDADQMAKGSGYRKVVLGNDNDNENQYTTAEELEEMLDKDEELD